MQEQETSKKTAASTRAVEDHAAELQVHVNSNIQRILDIELPLTVSFGRAKKALSEIVKLAPGSILELDTPEDELAVLKVNDKVFARGQIVEIDGFYGIQISEIDDTSDRIAVLGSTE